MYALAILGWAVVMLRWPSQAVVVSSRLATRCRQQMMSFVQVTTEKPIQHYCHAVKH